VIPGFPAELSAIVLRALAKDPDDRFQTAEDLRIALEGWIASSGSKASEREIATLVRATTGDEIEKRSRVINDAIAKLKERPSDRPESAERNSRSMSPAVPTTSGGREGASTVDRGVATGTFREKSSSWWLPVGAGLAVLGVVVVLAKGTLGTVQPPVSEPASRSEPMPQSTVAASEPVPANVVVEKPALVASAEPVQIIVRTVPANAILRIDDGAPLAAPYRTQLVPSSTVRVVRASAPGYASLTREIAFDRTQEIVLELDPVQPQAPSQRRQKPTRRVESQAVSNPTPVETTSSARPGDSMAPPAKRPRALDEDNPFSG
jgi:hypothetical protein